MADTIFQGFFKALFDGDLDGAPDIRLKLTMAGFTGAGEEDATNIADITDLDEFDGVGYQEIDCADVDFSYDAVAHEYQLTFDADEFNIPSGTVAPGSGDAEGLFVYLYVDGTSANDVCLAHTTSGGFPLNGTNQALTYTPHADGLSFVKAA